MARPLRTSLLLCALVGAAAAREPNYDEAKVAPYTLPDPLVAASGARLTSPDQWPARRAEILTLFQSQMYGAVPPPPAHLRLDTFESGELLDGRVLRKQIRMTFSPDGTGPAIDWIVFLPKDAKGPAPAFVGLNFYGNQEILPDPAIRVTTGWLRDDAKHFISGHRASEQSRGLSATPGASQTWPVDLLAARGYALVTACYGEVAPDDKDAYTNGVFALFPPTTPGVGSNTTALAAWAWGLMRGMDLIAREPALDARRVAAIGCSRLGKTALLAGALDERFAVVIPNQTGEGGVPLSKRDYGENVSTENKAFPHWFCGNYRKYSDNEAALPFDQHWLLACVAPRRLYVSSFPGKWFDPYGEFLSMKAAEPVWNFLGLPGLPASEWPAELSPTASTHFGYHRRPGEHGIARYDWLCYLAFTDRAFGQRVDWSPNQTDSWHGFKSEDEARAFRGNPVDQLEPLAKAGIPQIHVVGDADTTVPPASNTDVIEQRYKALGGTVTVCRKPGVGHHPHGLDDPAPLVRLIEDYTARVDLDACR
jgi:hypothetical protein